MKKMKNYLLLFFISTCIYTVGLSSQTTKSMYGKKFYISWPFNGGPDTTYCHFSIHALNKPTSGFIKTIDTTIHFTLTNFENSLTYTSINNPNTAQNFYSRYEVKESEVVGNKGVYIETQDSVFVLLYTQNINSEFYGNQPRHYSSENTLVYPLNTLSKIYRILTKSEDSASSQFVIVATEDSTEIEILPSQDTEKGKLKGVPFEVTLHKGQTYLVRSLHNDLTGTQILSKGPECKVFAVFVGSPRTTIAKIDIPFFRNKNTLLEQLPSPDLAGRRYIIERPIFNNNGPNYSIIRILALYDSTQILFHGRYLGGVMSAGQYVEINTDTSVYFYSEKPILVAQFMKSLPNYNPLMLIRNSIDHLHSRILFPSHLSRAPNFGNQSETSIVTRCSDTSSLFFNNVPQQNNPYRYPWEIIKGNTLYCSCIYLSIDISKSLLIESITGGGIVAMNYAPFFMHSYAMSGVTSFESTLYNKIDTSGSFSYFSYCQNGVSTFEANADSNANNFYWEFGDGNKAEGRTVLHIYKNSGPHTVKLIVY